VKKLLLILLLLPSVVFGDGWYADIGLGIPFYNKFEDFKGADFALGDKIPICNLHAGYSFGRQKIYYQHTSSVTDSNDSGIDMIVYSLHFGN